MRIDPDWSNSPPSRRLRSRRPTITGTINFGAAMSGEFVYSGMALRDIKDGKIATMQVERANFTVNTQQAGKADKMTGEIAQYRLARLRCRCRCRHPRSAKGERRPILSRLRQDDGRPLHRHFCARPSHAHRRDDASMTSAYGRRGCNFRRCSRRYRRPGPPRPRRRKRAN